MNNGIIADRNHLLSSRLVWNDAVVHRDFFAYSMNNVTVSDFNDLFSSWPAGNEVLVHRDIPEYFGRGLECLALKFKFKRNKRPCS